MNCSICNCKCLNKRVNICNKCVISRLKYNLVMDELVKNYKCCLSQYIYYNEYKDLIDLYI